jgi:hypothetical protein
MTLFLRLFVSAACISAAAAQTAKAPAPPPTQPIPYSHKKHVGELKLKCNTCHANKDPGETMGLPPVSVCMTCHSSVKTDSPAIQKLAEFAKAGRPVRWVRVYEIPTFVMFSHRAHLEAKNTCQDCHGQVAEREQIFREADITMGGCMSCHKTKNASNDCTFCHEAR